MPRLPQGYQFRFLFSTGNGLNGAYVAAMARWVALAVRGGVLVAAGRGGGTLGGQERRLSD